MDKNFSDTLDLIRDNALFRSIRTIASPQGAHIDIDGSTLFNLSSNDYLGFANHPNLAKASIAAIDRFGTGAGASRLVVGNNLLYDELESSTARMKVCDDAIIFQSGYHANLGLFTALADDDTEFFSDALNHASIIDGLKLTGSPKRIYPHLDCDTLDSLLDRSTARRKVIVTESVFSMDGDIADTVRLADIADRYEAYLVIDDAHGTGVLGPHGFGVTELVSRRRRTIFVGTFSKALGSFGAYVAGERPLRDLLVNRARSLIFSTALPPGVLGANIAALALITEEPERVERLRANSATLRTSLTSHGIAIENATTPIIPILIGPSDGTMQASEQLNLEGIIAVGIRPPTVPVGTARLRLSVTSEMSEGELIHAARTIAEAARREVEKP